MVTGEPNFQHAGCLTGDQSSAWSGLAYREGETSRSCPSHASVTAAQICRNHEVSKGGPRITTRTRTSAAAPTSSTSHSRASR
jgi:hypothetical protein